ncbi:MAG: TolC family protein, partial [Cyclobacteriaceae bacterium]
MLRFLLILIVAFTTTYSAFAQEENGGKEWTLQECVKVALDNNLNVRRGLYNVEGFKVGLFQSKMSFLPTLNAGSSFGQNFGRAVNPVSNTFVNRNSNNINLQANSSLTLFNGLRLQNSFRQSQRDYLTSFLAFSRSCSDA